MDGNGTDAGAKDGKPKLRPRWETGPVLEKTLAWAANRHSGQARKGTTEPYLSHLLAVASLVIEYGGDETQTCAALLHDIIEDQGVKAEVVTEVISATVADMVVACSDRTGDTQNENGSVNWGPRKAKYHRDLSAKKENDPALLVSICDKINNAERSAVDRRNKGTVAFWKEFNAGDSCQQWNYERLYEAFRDRMTDPDLQPVLLRFREALDDLFGGRDIEKCTVDHVHGPEATARSAQ